jgi:hypothetical protein
MTKEKKDELRRLLYNGKFTTDSDDENPFVGMYFNDLLTIIKDYVEQPLIEKACQYLYDWNKKQVEKHGSKAVLGIREFTISVSGFRKEVES